LAATADLGFQAQIRSDLDSEWDVLRTCCLPDSDEVASPSSPSFDYPSLHWERLLASAEHHRLIPALNVAITSRQVPLQLPIRFHALNHAWRALQLSAELARIARHFEERRIEFLAYKGPALGQLLYGNPAMRQFGDLDLLVRPRHVELASSALAELGYEPQLRLPDRLKTHYLRSGSEYAFRRNSDPAPLEIHWQVVPRFYSIAFDIEAIFSRSVAVKVDDFSVRTLGRQDLLLALCVHAAKHEWSQLGMLRDVFTLAQFDLDWNWILHEADGLGILKIVQASLIAAHALFRPGMPTRIKTGALVPGVEDLVARVIEDLQRDCDPDTESIGYFRRQVQLRERLRDRARFLIRLAMTPGITEWEAVQIPDALSAMYHFVRACRLLKRLLKELPGALKNCPSA
jgi:putative nucleotidyltransferase-like protein